MDKHSNTTTTTTSMTLSSQTPTTFVQADTTTFRDLVQKLTGSSSDHPSSSSRRSSSLLSTTKPIDHSSTTGIRRSPFKLQERRHHHHHNTMRKLEVVKLGLTSLHNTPRHTTQCILSPPAQSPVTPLGIDSIFASRFGTESPPSVEVVEEEERAAIKEKGFYLHPSPRKALPPELLTLFPMTSPRQNSTDS